MQNATRAQATKGNPLPAADAAALHRREFKFVYRREALDDLLDILSVNARPIRFGKNPESEVRSIYFDDEHLTSCLQSLDGVNPRNKVRLRWYDREWPEHQAVFELKHKRGNYVSKSRTAIKLDASFQDQAFAAITDSIIAALPDNQAAWLQAWSNPIMLVSYRRRHFLDRDTPIRLTLDYDIIGYDQTGSARPTTRIASPTAETLVLEVKAPRGFEADINRLLYPLKPRLVRYSKYAQCCAHMDWQGGLAREI